MERTSIRRVYVWQLPVRFYHWINALCILVLALTGYFIGNPLTWTSHVHPEASFGYWFGTIRFIHFVAAFVFFFNFLFRLYWGFVGNRYADWKNFIMYRKDQLEEAKAVLRTDIFQRAHKPLPSVGHNALAGNALEPRDPPGRRRRPVGRGELAAERLVLVVDGQVGPVGGEGLHHQLARLIVHHERPAAAPHPPPRSDDHAVRRRRLPVGPVAVTHPPARPGPRRCGRSGACRARRRS